jgi:metal-responsive CopG/Arc/MetJ family transcriptional regulator
MAKKVASARKGPGRPVKIGATAFVGSKFPPALVKEIDQWAAKNGDIGRSEAMRQLIELGLKQRPTGRKQG